MYFKLPFLFYFKDFYLFLLSKNYIILELFISPIIPYVEISNLLIVVHDFSVTKFQFFVSQI